MVFVRVLFIAVLIVMIFIAVLIVVFVVMVFVRVLLVLVTLVLVILVAMLVVMVFVAVLVVVVFVAVLIVMAVVVVAALAELDRGDATDRLVNGDAVGFRGLDHVEEPFFKGSAVDDECLGLADLCDLLGRCLEIVRVGADRHDRDDVQLVADDVGDDVAKDVGGHGDGRRVGRGVAGGDGIVGSAGRCDERQHGEEGEKEAAGEAHEISRLRTSINIGHATTLPGRRQLGTGIGINLERSLS